MTAETWRVVCEGGAAHEVSARHTPGSYGGKWRADSDGAAAGGSSARTAVLALAAGTGWPVVELVAPGETTAAERLAQAIAERVALADADLIMEQRERQITASLTTAAAERARCAAVCRAVATALDDDTALACAEAIERGPERDACEAISDRDYWREQAIGMAPCVDGMRAITSLLIPGGTGCIVDPERVVAAVAALRAIIAGRTVAPSDEEIAAHAAAGGSWLVRYRRDETTTTRVGWHPLDATGRPTTWPTGGGL